MSITSESETLRSALTRSMDALQRKRANEIPEALIERLVEIDWLEWQGGTLRLTATGQNIHRHELAQIRARSESKTGEPSKSSLKKEA